MRNGIVTFIALGCLCLTMSGCSGFWNYTSIGDTKQYYVVGRVVDAFEQPVEDCEIYLAQFALGFLNRPGDITPVAITDQAGNYHFTFQRKNFSDLCLLFDAEDRGYALKQIDFSNLLESQLFQYTGNNPLIVNALLKKNLSEQAKLGAENEDTSGNGP